MQLFTKAIIQVGIFMICAQVLIHFRPNGSYEKYMKMLVSVMILVQVFGPLISLITGGKESVEERVSWFEAQIQESMAQAQEAAKQTDELLNRMTLNEVYQRMEESVRDGEGTGRQAEESGTAPKEDQTQELRKEELREEEPRTEEPQTGSEPEQTASGQPEQDASGIQPVERIEIEIGN